MGKTSATNAFSPGYKEMEKRLARAACGRKWSQQSCAKGAML